MYRRISQGLKQQEIKVIAGAIRANTKSIIELFGTPNTGKVNSLHLFLIRFRLVGDFIQNGFV
jgi:hypothetical protein